MISGIDRSDTVDGLMRACEEALGADAKGLLILACDSNGFTPRDVDGFLRDIRIPVFGGIFPGIIYGRERLERGTIAVGLPVRPSVAVIGGLSDKFDARFALFLSCASHALTLGEIANSRRDYLEFYNKTSVVGIFEWL